MSVLPVINLFCSLNPNPGDCDYIGRKTEKPACGRFREIAGNNRAKDRVNLFYLRIFRGE